MLEVLKSKFSLFINKIFSTEQETFFPRKKIIERVQTILECKDGISLDELAYKFSKNIKDILINKTYIIDKNIVSSSIVNLFEEFMGSNEKYDEKSLLALMVFKEMIDRRDFDSVNRLDINGIYIICSLTI